MFDAATFQTRTLKVKPSKFNPLTGENPTQTTLIDYEEFCNVDLGFAEEKTKEVKEIDVQTLKTWSDEKLDFQLIDVREPYEYEIVNLAGELIPLGQVEAAFDKIARNKKVIIHCRSGKRSADAIRKLEEAFGFDNLYNLKGGVLAYAKEIDTSLATY